MPEPGTLEGLIEAADMNVISAGEADCPFVYPDTETFWKANIASGPLQGAMGIVGEDILKAAVSDAVEPYRADDGGLQFENAFRYVTATSTNNQTPHPPTTVHLSGRIAGYSLNGS